MPLQFVTDQYGDLSVTTPKINDLAVTTGKLAANAVTPAKADLAQTWAFSVVPTSSVLPVFATDLANKAYVDSISAGLDPKASVRVATTGPLQNAPTYNNGIAGTGATLTASVNGSINAVGIDLVTDLAVNDRIMVKDQVAELQNGIYVVTVIGDGSTAYVLTRATDHDNEDEVSSGNLAFVEEGDSNATTLWFVITPGLITMGTTAIEWSQFAGGGTVAAGDGIFVSGVTVSVDLATDPGLEFSGGDLQVMKNDIGGAGLATVVDRSADGLAVRVDDVTIEGSVDGPTGVLQVIDDSIDLTKSGWRPAHEPFTGTGAVAIFALANPVLPAFYDGVCVYRQGQRIQKVAGAPADLSQYRVFNDFGTTKIELGANLPLNDDLLVDYVY